MNCIQKVKEQSNGFWSLEKDLGANPKPDTPEQHFGGEKKRRIGTVVRNWKSVLKIAVAALALIKVIFVLLSVVRVGFGWDCGLPGIMVDSSETNVGLAQSARPLRGKFLHITDIHPDSLFREGTSIKKSCHRGKPKDKHDKASHFGDATSGCDAPMALFDATMDWIETHLRDEVDFVLWTGDNMRHDNDRDEPRTESDITEMNKYIAERFYDLFRTRNSSNPFDMDVAVIPSLGNNDVYPHNVFALGPTIHTRELYSMWSYFIPENQRHTFERYASFFAEAIPGKLAVISLNTMYLYKSNPLVDNCDSEEQPGYALLLWFGSVLQEIRHRGMKVIISGHVPPTEKNCDKSCFNKMTLWVHEYRDIIVASIYGHMNIDHFVPVSAAATKEGFESSALDKDAQYQFHAEGAKPVNKDKYMKMIRETTYKKIAEEHKSKKISEEFEQDSDVQLLHLDDLAEDYSIVHVSTSVIPTFNPGFRVWQYNITDINKKRAAGSGYLSWEQFFETLEAKIENLVDAKGNSVTLKESTWKRGGESPIVRSVPEKKPRNLPLGPAYTPQLFSLVKFTQYYADLQEINAAYEDALKDGKSKKEAVASSFRYKVEYSSDSKPYSMKSLLVKEHLNLAIKLYEDDDLWHTYLKRSFALSGYHDKQLRKQSFLDINVKPDKALLGYIWRGFSQNYIE